MLGSGIAQEVQRIVAKFRENAAEVAVVEDQDQLNIKVYRCNPHSRQFSLRVPLITAHGEGVGPVTAENARSVGFLSIRGEFTSNNPDLSGITPSFVGTAFVVAKLADNTLLLQTAAHNVRSTPDFSLNEWYFTLDAFKPDMHEHSRFFRCRVLGRGNIEGKDEDPVSHVHLADQNDVAILEVQVSQEQYDCAQILVPVLPQDGFVGIIGHPSDSSVNEMLPQIDLIPAKVVQEVTYNRIRGLFFNFTNLALSVGQAGKSALPHATHSASTTKGFSGSPVTSLTTSGIYYGMHVSGPPRFDSNNPGRVFDLNDLNHNIFITSRHPAMVHLYQQFVVRHIDRNSLQPAVRTAFEAWCAAVGV